LNAVPVHLPSTVRLVATLRCMGPKHLHQLAYGPMTSRAAQARTARMVTLGFLQRTRPRGLNSIAYFLTEKGRQATPLTAAMSEQVRRVPAPDVAFCALQRASLWASLVADGWAVGCGVREQLALRRDLVDRQKMRVDAAIGSAKDSAARVLSALRAHPALSPAFEVGCSSCGLGYAQVRRASALCDCGSKLTATVITNAGQCRCGQTVNVDDSAQVDRHRKNCGPTAVRLTAPLPFDVATRAGEVVLLLVEDPRRSIFAQVADLPLRVLGQPRLPVILRPSDDDSLYDASARRWLQKGKRYRLLERLFSEEHVDGHFPFSTTSKVVDYRPETALRVLHRQGTNT
jgi:hypothetical protein